MNTDKLARLTHAGGATNGQFYGLEIAAAGGVRCEVGFDDADLVKMVEVLMGLSADAASIAGGPPKTPLTLSKPLPVGNLVLMAGANPDEIVLGIQTGKLTLPFSLHKTTLAKLFAALQNAKS